MEHLYETRVRVRGYELDSLGHLNSAVYLQYAEHARWEYLRSIGITAAELAIGRRAPVLLEVTVRYLAELNGGDEVDITFAVDWGTGRTFPFRQEIRKADGTLSAEVTGVAGVLDLDTRRLVAEPGAALLGLAGRADRPGLLDVN